MTTNHLVKHTVRSYDSELESIVNSLKDMRHFLMDLLDLAVFSISGNEEQLTQKAYEIDKKINALDDSINEVAVGILALRQPVAIDLRFVVSSLRITTILERMGDKAKNCIKRIIEIDSRKIPDTIKEELLEMVKLVKKMIKNSVKGFGKIDIEKANKVWEREEKVDILGHKIYEEIQSYMEKDKNFIPLGMKLLFVMKDIERIGDYATNITKLVNYVSSGERKSQSGEEE